MIELKGTIIIPKDAIENVRDAMNAHIAATRLESGCIVFEINQDENEPETFHVFEQFKTKADFDNHQDLGKLREWGALAKDFKRAFTITEK